MTSIAGAMMLSGAPLAASGACAHAAHRNPYGFGRAWTGSQRRAWRLLAAAAFCWGIGRIVSSYLQLVGGNAAPFPSLADLSSLCAVPLATAAMLSFPTAPARPVTRLRAFLDCLLMTVSLLYLSWATVLGDAFRTTGSSALARVVLLAYPLGDVVIGTTAFMLLVRARGRSVVQLSIIAAGILALAVSDSSFAYLTQTGAYRASALTNTGWLIGWLLFMLAALKPTVAELRLLDDNGVPSIARLALPYAPLVLAAVTALAVQMLTGHFQPGLVYLGTVIMLLVISRQVVALVENRQLNARLQATVVQLSEREQELKDALRRELAAADHLRRQRDEQEEPA